MKHIRKLTDKMYKTGLINGLLSRFKLMPERWSEKDNQKITNLFEDEITRLNQKIKDKEKELESLKSFKNSLNDKFIEYRKKYRK